MRRLEVADIERRMKIVGEDAFADADRAVELIVVEKAATAARRQHGFVPKRRQRLWQAVVESAGASLEKKIGARAEAGAGKAGEQAEFGLPPSAAENIAVERAMATVFRGQECFDNGLYREPEHPRIEDRFVLDHDNVGR